MKGKDYIVYVPDNIMNDLRRWHNERGGDPEWTDAVIIVSSLDLYWYKMRKDEIWSKYYGPGGSENYPEYTRAVELLRRKETKLNDPMINELEKLWKIKEDTARNTDWENGPDDHRLYPENNKDLKI